MSPIAWWDSVSETWISPTTIPDPPDPPDPTEFTLSEAWFASNTGYRVSESSLVPWSGSYTLSTPGATYTGYEFNDTVIPSAPNITFIDCLFNAGYWAIDSYDQDADNLLVSHCTILGGSDAGIALTHTGAGTVEFCDISGGFDGMKASGSDKTIRYNYIHDLFTDEESHNDGIQIMGSGSDFIFYRNWIASPDTSCIAIFEGQTTMTRCLIEENMLTGPGFPLYLGGSGGTYLEVLDNTFGTWGYGPVSDWAGSAPGNVWSGNVRAVTGVPVNP